MIKKYHITNNTTIENYTILKESSEEARHWVINHLNLSLNLTIKETN
jgi:hypothetical protein